MQRIMTVALAAVAAVAMAACSDSTSPTNGTVQGTYSLHTVNGQPLPYTFYNGGQTAQLTADQVTLRSDGSYEDDAQYVINGNQPETDIESGTYSNSGGAITFYDATDRITYQGSVSGNVLTEVVNGLTEVYQR